jgi:hypothetical protein
MPEKHERPEFIEIRLERRRVPSTGQSGYIEGGARGEVCKNSGPAANTTSCGNGKEATGFSIEMEGAATNPDAV